MHSLFDAPQMVSGEAFMFLLQPSLALTARTGSPYNKHASPSAWESHLSRSQPGHWCSTTGSARTRARSHCCSSSHGLPRIRDSHNSTLYRISYTLRAHALSIHPAVGSHLSGSSSIDITTWSPHNIDGPEDSSKPFARKLCRFIFALSIGDDHIPWMTRSSVSQSNVDRLIGM